MCACKSFNVLQNRRLSYKKVVSWYSGLVRAKPSDPPFGHIVQIGDPTLRTTSEEVPVSEIESPPIKYLLGEMKKVFNKYNCVGLSATQIGMPFRVIMYEFSKKHAKLYSSEEQKFMEMKLVPFTVVINPTIKIEDYTKVTFPESCESVRGFYADVPRFRALQLKGFGEDGKDLQIQATGWLARVVQHEMDHLNGKLYTDVMDRKSLTCSCWQVINERRGKVELPYSAS